MFDEEIKNNFKSCESQLSHLRQIFKLYQEKNKITLGKAEIQQRTTIIDKLRKNLNLLKDEFNAQVDRAKVETEKKSLFKQKNRQPQAEFINLFGSINQDINEPQMATEAHVGEEAERSLNEDEQKYLDAFEENDKALDSITHEIIKGLEVVKLNAENIETGIDKQTKLLNNQ